MLGHTGIADPTLRRGYAKGMADRGSSSRLALAWADSGYDLSIDHDDKIDPDQETP